MANIYLTENHVDDLGRMVLALLSEFWIMRDRMAILEALLDKAGVVKPEEIEGFAFTPEQEARLDALRDRIIAMVLGAPLAARDRTVEDILARAGLKPEGETAE